MGNLGGMEILVILLVALVVLGPNKLPDAARQVGKAVTELRRLSSGFQRELRDAMEEPVAEAEARARGDRLIADEKKTEPPPAATPESAPDPEATVTDDDSA